MHPFPIAYITPDAAEIHEHNMLDKVPTEIIHIILERADEHMYEVADKLVRVSRSVQSHFRNPHTLNVLVPMFPVWQTCSIPKCRKRARYVDLHGARVCERHGCDPSKKVFRPTAKNVRKTLDILARKGYTTLLKFFLTKDTDIVDLAKLCDSAVAHGKLGCARYLQCYVRNLDTPTHQIFRWLQRHETATVKTWYSLGGRLCRMDLLEYVQREYLASKLCEYLLEWPHTREIMFPGWFDSNWELRLCYYFGNLDLIQWFLDMGRQKDVVCTDMFIVATSEGVCPMKRARYMQMLDFVHQSEWKADATLLYNACTLGCRATVFEKIVTRAIPLDQVQSSYPLLTQLVYACVRKDRANLLSKLHLHYWNVAYRYPSALLHLAIQWGSFDVVEFMVNKLNMKCIDGYLAPPSFDVLRRSVYQTKLLLKANVLFRDPETLFTLSTQGVYHRGLVEGLLMSKHYAKPYLDYMMKQDATKDLLLSRIQQLGTLNRY